MEAFWFVACAAMLTVYVLLDGFDLGAGICHLLVAKRDRERRTVLATIGPVWDGNEVWLIATGGVLFFAFPTLYAVSFSGFYLPLMTVLWLLMLRGISIEFRNHIDNPAWCPFWDVIFAGSSLALALFFGTALGNVVRGVRFDAQGLFFLPFWTDFGWRGEVGIVDGYTMLVGVTAVLALTLHGSNWIAMRTEGELRERARRLAGKLVWPLFLLTVVLTAVTWRIQPQVAARFLGHPVGFLFPAVVLAAIGISIRRASASDLRLFLGSCSYLLGMMGSAAYGLYPYVLPAVGGSDEGLTARDAAAGAHGLRVGLAWWIPGMLLVSVYFLYLYRVFSGRVRNDSR